MTISVKNAQDQRIEIFDGNEYQETVGQKIDIEQDIIVVPIYEDVPQYEGAYEVTPKVEAQTMPTKDKLLIEDMKVNAIPFFNVSNTSGGSTVFIGKEV